MSAIQCDRLVRLHLPRLGPRLARQVKVMQAFAVKITPIQITSAKKNN